MRRLVLSLLSVVTLGCGALPTEVAVSAAELPIAEEVLREGAGALRVATIRQDGSDTTMLELPAVARRGEVTEMYLTTYAGGCIGRDTTVARVDGRRATIVPYQRVFVPPATVGCTRDLRFDRRTIRVTFATSGDAIVRVVGRVAPDRGLVAIERRLVVQ